MFDFIDDDSFVPADEGTKEFQPLLPTIQFFPGDVKQAARTPYPENKLEAGVHPCYFIKQTNFDMLGLNNDDVQKVLEDKYGWVFGEVLGSGSKDFAQPDYGAYFSSVDVALLAFTMQNEFNDDGKFYRGEYKTIQELHQSLGSTAKVKSRNSYLVMLRPLVELGIYVPCVLSTRSTQNISLYNDGFLLFNQTYGTKAGIYSFLDYVKDLYNAKLESAGKKTVGKIAPYMVYFPLSHTEPREFGKGKERVKLYSPCAGDLTHTPERVQELLLPYDMHRKGGVIEDVLVGFEEKWQAFTKEVLPQQQQENDDLNTAV